MKSYHPESVTTLGGFLAFDAPISNFGITIVFNASVANPINATSFTAVAPWGQSTPKPNIEEAVNEVLHRGGSQYSGAFYNYMNSQAVNGPTGSGVVAYTAANQL